MAAAPAPPVLQWTSPGGTSRSRTHPGERLWAVALGVLTSVVGGATALTGLLTAPADPVRATTVRGHVVELYGAGLYRYDSVFTGAGHRGTDLVVVMIGVPLMVACVWGTWRGSRRAALLLSGAFAWFLYVYASMALGAAYNDAYLAYVVLLSASLAGGILAVRAVAPEDLAAVDRLPRRLVGWLLIGSGVVTAVIWLGPVVAARLAGGMPPRLGSATTFVTYALDSAVIAPLAVVAGLLVLRGRAAGYVIAVPLLVVLAALAPTIAAQTAFQLGSGVELTGAEVTGPVTGFVVLAGLAVLALVRVMQAVPRAPTILRARRGALLPPSLRWPLATFLMVHGAVHAIGVVVPFRLATVSGFTYRTTVTGGLDVGHAGVRGLAVAWALAGVALVAAGVALAADAPLWPQLVLSSSAASAVLTTLWVDVAGAGLAVNALLAAVAVLVLARGRRQETAAPPDGSAAARP